MKLFITKLFPFTILCCLVLLFNAGRVEAASPNVVGRVVTSGTNTPVVGVWVKWTDNDGNFRHEKTDNNGNFIFPSWQDLSDSDRNTQMTTRIDSNLDGINDTYQAEHNSGNKDKVTGFGCFENPHNFAVVSPVGMNGSFTKITGVKVNNGQGTVVLSNIVFTPNVVAPTSTPIPTPPGLIMKTVNFGIIPVSGISGIVFIDSDLNGSQNGSEGGYPGGATITVIGTSYAQTTTDGAGNFSFQGLPNGPYTVFLTVPNNYSSTSPTNANVTIGPGGYVSFGIASAFTINGKVFNDINKNFVMDFGETTIADAVIESTGGTVVTHNGSYEIQDLKAGTYTISYTSPLPKGFIMLYPKSVPPLPPSFTVKVGPGCAGALNTTTGAKCASGNINGLNFSITDSIPWTQAYNLDLRFDNGFKDVIPASPDIACGGGAFASANNPGIVFTGDITPDFGQGSASMNNWVVGGGLYEELFKNTTSVKTSTQNLFDAAGKAGITITPLESFSPCKNPYNKCNLQGLQKGFYHTTGDINFDHSVNFQNGNYIIVADGNMTITKGIDITVSTGSTVLFATGGDIVIDKTIHASSNTCSLLPAGQLQGVFSADRNIKILGLNNGSGNCLTGADKMLNIEGALIVNAGKQNGTLQNQRDLCVDNPKFPALTIKARPDFILNMPGFLTEQQTISHEEAP
jgi:hypothetical protein